MFLSFYEQLFILIHMGIFWSNSLIYLSDVNITLNDLVDIIKKKINKFIYLFLKSTRFLWNQTKEN